MAAPSSTAIFPEELRGKRVLLATESLGPVNGVSRTTQSLVDYLRANGVNVAICAPRYTGQTLCGSQEVKDGQDNLINKDWTRYTQAQLESQRSAGLAGLWTFHNEKVQERQPLQRMPRMLNSTSTKVNPEYRVDGISLPYNPDLTVAYPFRMGVIYSKTFKPDLIYLASPASVGFQFLVQLAQLSSPPPTMLNFQTDLAHYATIIFRQPIRHYAVWMLHCVQGRLFSIAAVRKIFYPSGYVRKYMEDTGAPPEKMQQLGRGVDTNLFNPNKRDNTWRTEIAPDGEIIFCCISRLAPEKGFDFLAKVATKLADSGLQFKLLIVGGNKNPVVENEVMRYFKHLDKYVVFTGMLRGTALASAYAIADVFLHCSITETFGLVVLESMASGVPVVARNEGGPSETVQHGKSGFLAPPYDLESFVKYARQLAMDPLLRKTMAVSARQQAEDTTWDKINNRVAIQMAQAIQDAAGVAPYEGCYGSIAATCRVYLAVGVIWLFWIIAVLPMLLCGYFHG
ncbi:glycosyltransferase family 4 protein [Polychaeton citri CBS 116435]|uniref:Glycosyltransferase family 4 protein n=1 Tax=Polychaeton citri CBS 116435 TaxID=1314669 RepID=A0A9P4PZG1_9PEZI|nr:glycosyltransferase family 4 protein [Polychaeton citri CBS 116435]